MDKTNKLKHTLYELEMKIINLEDKKSKKGLVKKEQSELDILNSTRNKLLIRIEKSR